jgi:hypothetical protein
MRNLTGIFFAVAFLLHLTEALRFLGMPSNAVANMRQIFYALDLIVVIYWYGLKKSEEVR